jgi:hypothetical protein
LPELKTHAPDADNATTGNPGGGFGLPRVKPTNPATLEPFLPASTSAAEKTKRAGLMSYNVISTGLTEDTIFTIVLVVK